MALTNAERQKLYRERQKNKNKDDYLKKEAKRKRDAYTPSCMLSPAALTQRREKPVRSLKSTTTRKRKCWRMIKIRIHCRLHQLLH